MKANYRHWQALSGRQRFALASCMAGLTAIHGCLALLGYVRTRHLVETVTRARSRRAPSPLEIDRAQDLAKLAAAAGRHGAVQASCLRQALLLYGWLRLQGLMPSLHLGVAHHDGPFRAHAWVELGDARLLASDEGHHPFRCGRS